MDMSKIVGAVITIGVSIIIIGTVLAPTIADLTKDAGADPTKEPAGALNAYKGLLGAVVILTIVVVLMVAVRLVTNRE